MSSSQLSYAYHLGIDLHKKFAYWTLMDDHHVVRWEGEVPTNREAVAEAVQTLPCEFASTQAAIEPVQEWAWYGDLLEEHGITVRLVDTLKTKDVAKHEQKSDRIDSYLLADLLRVGFLRTGWRAPREIRDLRELVRLRVMLVRQRSTLKVRLRTIMAKNELRCPYTDIMGVKACNWIARQSLSDVYQQEVSVITALAQTLHTQIYEMDKDIDRRAAERDDARLLRSVPGIGSFAALTVVAEVGDFSRFATPDHLAAYAGLVPFSNSSGEGHRTGHITKRGSPHLRWLMVQVAQRVNPEWGRLYRFYQRIKKRRGSQIAKVALARKLLCICWTLMYKQEPFDGRALECRSGISGSAVSSDRDLNSLVR